MKLKMLVGDEHVLVNETEDAAHEEWVVSVWFLI
jgi:hypothetical protein